MAAIPVTIQAQIYPKDKTVKPYPATILGFASITGLEVGGGPIIPPDELPDLPKPPGDLIIWGGGNEPFPTPPIVIPEPPPVDQPATPQPPHEGWNWSAAKSGWYYLYVPGEGEAGPKRSR